MKPVLKIENLSVKIGDKEVLKNISIEAEEKKITGIIGGSGSGKTTILKTVLNLQIPENAKISGTILFKEVPVEKVLKRVIQPVFQDPIKYFNPGWSLKKCLEEPFRLNFEYPEEERNKLTYDYLKYFQIEIDSLSKNIRTFSGGELQRISMIRALLCEPEILLMDEPVSGLDPIIQRKTLALIKKLNKDKEISILIISHDIDFIRELCDSIYVIHSGRIIEEGNPETILENPKSDYTKKLIDSRNLSDIRRK